MKNRVFAVSGVLTFALVLSPLTITAVAAPASKVFVTNSNDSGPGSFREAINQANGNPAVTRVQVRGDVTIVSLSQTVLFEGAQDLTIDGNGATLDGANLAPEGPALRVTGGGNLTVLDLTVRDAPAEGIAFEVPTFATGIVYVSLTRVDIIGNAGHGVLVNDQDDPATIGIVEGDSPASVAVSIVHTRFIGNGFSVSDRDGLRVNEGGDGDLIITIRHSLAQDNGADGIEADERGSGDVLVEMVDSDVIGNGEFDPADLDDGFDIDENDDGSIVGSVIRSSASNNHEEGFDFNENHAGDLRVDMRQVEANGNGEEGIDYEEDDDFAGGGDLVTTMTRVTANGNGPGGDAGLKIREKGAGNLDVTLNHVETSNNLIGGVSIREDEAGTLVASIARATSVGNSGHGIDFDENRVNAADASGALTATVTRSTSSNNGLAGVRADSQTPGAGTLTLDKVTVDGNAGGPTTGNNVQIVF